MNCNPSYTPNTEDINDDQRIINEFLDGICAIKIKKLREKFMKADSDDNMKMVKLVILYFIELVLLEKVNRNYTNETYVLFVDNFNKLNEYP